MMIKIFNDDLERLSYEKMQLKKELEQIQRELNKYEINIIELKFQIKLKNELINILDKSINELRKEVL